MGCEELADFPELDYQDPPTYWEPPRGSSRCKELARRPSLEQRLGGLFPGLDEEVSVGSLGRKGGRRAKAVDAPSRVQFADGLLDASSCLGDRRVWAPPRYDAGVFRRVFQIVPPSSPTFCHSFSSGPFARLRATT